MERQSSWSEDTEFPGQHSCDYLKRDSSIPPWRNAAVSLLQRKSGDAIEITSPVFLREQDAVIGVCHCDVGLCPETMVGEGRGSSAIQVCLNLRIRWICEVLRTLFDERQ
jgi:hypothetical protein